MTTCGAFFFITSPNAASLSRRNSASAGTLRVSCRDRGSDEGNTLYFTLQAFDQVKLTFEICGLVPTVDCKTLSFWISKRTFQGPLPHRLICLKIRTPPRWIWGFLTLGCSGMWRYEFWQAVPKDSEEGATSVVRIGHFLVPWIWRP